MSPWLGDDELKLNTAAKERQLFEQNVEMSPRLLPIPPTSISSNLGLPALYRQSYLVGQPQRIVEIYFRPNANFTLPGIVIDYYPDAPHLPPVLQVGSPGLSQQGSSSIGDVLVEFERIPDGGIPQTRGHRAITSNLTDYFLVASKLNDLRAISTASPQWDTKPGIEAPLGSDGSQILGCPSTLDSPPTSIAYEQWNSLEMNTPVGWYLDGQRYSEASPTKAKIAITELDRECEIWPLHMTNPPHGKASHGGMDSQSQPHPPRSCEPPANPSLPQPGTVSTCKSIYKAQSTPNMRSGYMASGPHRVCRETVPPPCRPGYHSVALPEKEPLKIRQQSLAGVESLPTPPSLHPLSRHSQPMVAPPRKRYYGSFAAPSGSQHSSKPPGEDYVVYNPTPPLPAITATPVAPPPPSHIYYGNYYSSPSLAIADSYLAREGKRRRAGKASFMDRLLRLLQD